MRSRSWQCPHVGPLQKRKSSAGDQEWQQVAKDLLHQGVGPLMIRKLKSGQYRLYSQSRNLKTGKHRNLGTFETRVQAEQHEREVQFFKRRGLQGPRR